MSLNQAERREERIEREIENVKTVYVRFLDRVEALEGIQAEMADRIAENLNNITEIAHAFPNAIPNPVFRRIHAIYRHIDTFNNIDGTEFVDDEFMSEMARAISNEIQDVVKYVAEIEYYCELKRAIHIEDSALPVLNEPVEMAKETGVLGAWRAKLARRAAKARDARRREEGLQDASTSEIL
ncbi:MAG: hypothetical protein Q6370_021290 [Candidatus Sigynarchaeota archaeon]